MYLVWKGNAKVFIGWENRGVCNILTMVVGTWQSQITYQKLKCEIKLLKLNFTWYGPFAVSPYKNTLSCVGSDPAVEVSHSWQVQTRATGFLSRERSGVRDNREVVGWRVWLSGQGTKFCHGHKWKAHQKKCQILSEKMERNVFSKNRYCLQNTHKLCKVNEFSHV